MKSYSALCGLEGKGQLHASTSGDVDLTSGLQNIGGWEALPAEHHGSRNESQRDCSFNQVKVQNYREAGVRYKYERRS